MSDAAQVDPQGKACISLCLQENRFFSASSWNFTGGAEICPSQTVIFAHFQAEFLRNLAKSGRKL